MSKWPWIPMLCAGWLAYEFYAMRTGHVLVSRMQGRQRLVRDLCYLGLGAHLVIESRTK